MKIAIVILATIILIAAVIKLIKMVADDYHY